MGLNWPILTVASDPHFWSDYFFETHVSVENDGYTSLVNHVEPLTEAAVRELEFHQIAPPANRPLCRFDVPIADVTLRLEFDPRLYYRSLQLVSSSTAVTEIAWDDEAHWHPDVLRWEELELICRYIALLDERFPHPGIPLLLLHRFAPITNADDASRIQSLVRDAWRRLNVVSEEQVASFLPTTHLLGTSVEWREDATAGWHLRVNDDEQFKVGLYTLRRLDNPEFPFAVMQRAIEIIRAKLKQPIA